ncbi:MAG: radical SAM protein [Candidatus Heimdallarchaeaceae archaeon]
MDGKKQFRIYDIKGKYAALSIDEVIANGLNHWKGWYCSAGVRNLYIDYDGNIFICNTASANAIDTFWREPWSERVEEIKRSLQNWDLTSEDYEPYRTEWRKMISKQDFSFSNEYVGKIGGDIDFPYEWRSCPFDSCACGADVVVSKSKSSSFSKLLTVTERGYDGQKETEKNMVDSIDDCVAAEMDFPIPYQILWDLTRRCNYNCSYCWPYVHNKTDKFLRTEMILDTCERLIYEWAGSEQIRFGFGGGEPTLHPQFIEIVKYLRENNQWVLVTTNGSMPPTFWLEAVKYINSINMSAHFEQINKDKFLANLQIMMDHHDKVDNDHWIEVKLMCPPGKVAEAVKFKEEIEKIDRLHVIGANQRMKGACSLVPIRQLEASGELSQYTEEEICQLQNQ